MTTELAPTICLQCLSAYTEGKLHYKWIKLDDVNFDPDLLQEELDDLLNESPAMRAEEWMIADFEGFGGIRIGEYESFECICELAQLVDEHGIAYGMYADNVGIEYATVEGFEDSYRGLWESKSEYAWEELEHLYNLNDNPLTNYIDIDSFIRELEHRGYHFQREDGVGVHVFSE